MNILIASYFFPPFSTIGAVRAGKFAKYLHHRGHDVRVLSCDDQPLHPSLDVELPEAKILRTRWLNVNAAAEMAAGGRAQVAARGFQSQRGGLLGGLLKRGKPLYKNLLNVPDAQVGWIPFALGQGLRWLGDWRPDVIFASAQPASSLVVGHALSKATGAPWVAELRDLLDDPIYYGFAPWRRRLDTALFEKILPTASGIVTVSDPMRQQLAARYRMPVCAILNGFDPHDFPENLSPPDDGVLRLVHTGQLYGGKRDPRPLFKALARLPEADRQRIEIQFFGRYVEPARHLADAAGVGDRVTVHDSIPYQESLRRQATADVLLLLMRDHAQEKGVFTGKLFEYLGARRPVLALGRRDNVACALVEDRDAGFVSLSPDAITAQLQRWLKQKARGGVPRLDKRVCVGLTRREKTSELEGFLEGVLMGGYTRPISPRDSFAKRSTSPAETTVRPVQSPHHNPRVPMSR